MKRVNLENRCRICNQRLIEIRDYKSYLAWDFCFECERYCGAKLLSEYQRMKKDAFIRKYGEVYLSERRSVKQLDKII